MKPLISVIIPFYNVDKYIEKCILSVIKQTYKNLEIILVDDGSTDKSFFIVKKYADTDKRIKLLQKENSGLSDARNYGLENSNGLITFIDSDDFVEYDYIEFLYELMVKYDSDISCCRELYIKNNEEIDYINKNEEGTYNNIEDILKDLYSLNNVGVSAWGKLYKRKIFDNLKFKKGIIYEDFDIIHLLFANADIVSYSTEKKYVYRMRKNSISNSTFSKKNMSIFDIIDNNKRYIKDNNIDVLKEFYFYSIKNIINIYKLLAFSKYEKQTTVKECRKRIRNYYNKSEKNLFTKKDKILITLIMFPLPIYKHLIKLNNMFA